MKKVIVLVLVMLLATVGYAQTGTSEADIEMQITDFKTLYAGMNIVFCDVVVDGKVIDSMWVRWDGQDLQDTQLELQIADFKTLHTNMNIVFYDVVVDGEVIDSYWTRWSTQD